MRTPDVPGLHSSSIVGASGSSSQKREPSSSSPPSVIALTGSDHAAFVAWLETPFATICMLLLLIALFHHTALGLQVIIEDYVHSGAKFAAIIATRLGCFALAVAGIVATLRIAFAG
ncbi:succinate dehydrogenase, hydrophobic membrane anchor protein [Pseudorhizobium halotolerans]|uniref:Succinate dehydrogenase hydrophobic membrane anchor subunit n=1 Tax=Pseudorhizobium halotolerans TaxID=1233081 RepID=A0ABM8PXC0_9HYPH|nr:succinate dehydrogenase, hydrophobic membrane anchor protein [Pseudorhizobium halotolerans]